MINKIIATLALLCLLYTGPVIAWEEHTCVNVPAREISIVVHGTRHQNPDVQERANIHIPSSYCSITPAAYYDLFMDTKLDARMYELLKTAVVSNARVSIAYAIHQAQGWYYAITSISIVGYN